MSGSSPKRVVLYRFDRSPSEGFISPAGVVPAGGLQIMSPGGNLQIVDQSSVKAVCFVSDSGPAKLFVEHTLFERRPKVPGLWTRFSLLDGDILDGILPHNLAEWPDSGFLITPPRAGSLRQKVFLPRTALRGTELMGIVGKPVNMQTASATRAGKRAGRDDGQLSIFDQDG